jgi:hypothetical protein
VPIDDDDWLAPDAGRLRRRLFPSTPGRHICITNNYAMVKTPEHRVLLQKHTRACGWFETHMETPVKTIEQPLSVMNRSIFSITSLREIAPPLARQKLLIRFHRYRRLYAVAPVEELAWVGTYRSMMAELMDELL